MVNRNINHTFLCLIPKKVDSRKVDFRAISLMSSFYKILAKLLANRSKEVLEDMVLKKFCIPFNL